MRDQVLVTAIELLSPANKRPGADGAEAYEKKRQELFASTAHLLELDLLRAGRRPQVARPLPEAPYFIFLSRMQRRPNIEIWPLSLRMCSHFSRERGQLARADATRAGRPRSQARVVTPGVNTYVAA